MDIKINKINSAWTMDAILIKETDGKIFVYSNERKTIIMHFPKHSYYYKKAEPDV
tara:strand:- start:3049 stop:3213 length:165 start_codon:yes stop_codon:yes gene_type:complete